MSLTEQAVRGAIRDLMASGVEFVRETQVPHRSYNIKVPDHEKGKEVTERRIQFLRDHQDFAVRVLVEIEQKAYENYQYLMNWMPEEGARVQ